MRTRIRAATDSDLGALAALARRTISACYRSFLGDDTVDSFIGGGAADRYVEENIGGCLVLLLEDRIVGFAVSRGRLIDLMMIDPSVHRQGLGTLLLERVESELSRTFAELRLESFVGNEGANAFYRKNGWRVVGRSLDEVSGRHKLVFGKSV